MKASDTQTAVTFPSESHFIVYADNSCSEIIGYVKTSIHISFYEAYDVACSKFPQYKRTLAIVDLYSGYMM